MEPEESGTRLGRYVLIRDIDGREHAVAATAVAAICSDDEDGALLMLPGGKLVRVDRPVREVVAWLNGQGPGCGGRGHD
jgi:putative intracellular protease/amidase